jgi:archaellum component FlaC
MAKKEINVFSVAFLDLLSGALAAVIILFVVIPKFTNEQIDAMETLDQLEVEVNQLDSLIQLAQNSIPTELYEQIQQQIQQLTETVDDLREEVSQLTTDLQNCEEAHRETQQQLEETQQQLQEVMEQMEQMVERTVDQATGPGQTLFGVNAKFSIVITWPDNLDVDMHIVNARNNEKVFYRQLNATWGSLLNDIQSRPEGEDIYELFYQKEITPGEYEIYCHLYSNVSQSVNVNGYVVIFPFKSNEYRIDLPSKTIRHSDQLVKMGTVHLSNNSFTLQNN